MAPIGGLIAAEYADREGPRFLEQDVFGTGDPEEIAGIIDHFCARQLGSRVERYEFFATSVMSVHGVRLADGRRVVVKLGRRSLGASFLAAVQRVQWHLVAHGFPCPRPVLEPTPVERGVAVVEELLDRGGRADAREPSIRRALAKSLASLVDLCRGFVTLDGLRPSLLSSPATHELWPEPHDRRFDFAATASGAEWIDELAVAARAALAAGAGEVVVGHSDWRSEHARFEGEELVAAYDWQSLAVGRETALLGSAGHAFTADWSLAQARRTPTLEEYRAFVADYEAARARRFSRAERRTIDAAWVYATASGARCEHSDARLGLPWAKRGVSEDSYRGLLARHGAELLP